MKTKIEYKQNNLTGSVLVISCLVAMLGLAGCEKEGSAEKVGKKIDYAKENVEQKIEQATEKAESKIDTAKESVEKAADKAEESIDKSTNASKEMLENAGKKMDQAAEDAEKDIESAKETVIDKTEKAGEFIDDSVITTNVKAALSNDSMLKTSPSQISVTTVNGVVKLSGTVDSEISIGRAMEIASSQKNVKSVQTDLTVIAIAPGK
jgi:hyperosmotically inducible protein